MKSLTPILASLAAAICFIGLSGCKAGDGLQESGGFSGLYSLGVTQGSQLSSADALTEIAQYCSPQNLPAYLDRIAKRLSFNAGYAEHPNAGYDANVIKQAGPDGVQAYYIGNGQMFDGAGSLAMFPPTNGNLSRLVAGYCGVVMASLGAGGGDSTAAFQASFGAAVSPKCGYPNVLVSKGGSVKGTSAAGSIGSNGCTVAKMQNASIKNTAEIAFCPDAIGGNFVSSGDGAAGEMSIIIRGGG